MKAKESLTVNLFDPCVPLLVLLSESNPSIVKLDFGMK